MVSQQSCSPPDSTRPIQENSAQIPLRIATRVALRDDELPKQISFSDVLGILGEPLDGVCLQHLPKPQVYLEMRFVFLVYHFGVFPE